MVRFTVLASGSKGNCTVVTGGRTRILVDAGLSCRELFRRMKLAGEEPETLDAIVITHEHYDHINGLAVTARKLGIPVYFTEGTHRAWMRWLTPRRQMTYAQWLEQCRKQAAERQAEAEAAQCDAENEPDEGDGMSGPEAIPTLTAESRHLEAAGSRRIRCRHAEGGPHLAAVGRILPGRPALRDRRYRHQPLHHSPRCRRPGGLCLPGRRGADGLCHRPGLHSAQCEGAAQGRGPAAAGIEPRPGDAARRALPLAVKQRVLSRVGHLSNEAAADFLENGYDGQAAYVILAHLSESNNLPELARVTAERALNGRASLLANRLLLAEQHEPLSPIYF